MKIPHTLPVQGYSITHRFAVGPQQGRKAFACCWQVADMAPPMSTEAHQRDKLDRPGGAPHCRDLTRPAVSEKRLALTSTQRA